MENYFPDYENPNKRNFEQRKIPTRNHTQHFLINNRNIFNHNCFIWDSQCL